jgi:nitronate monooxygenase
MNKPAMPKLRIGHLIADVPIVQGGMGVGISLSNLSSAVANEGAIGVIATAGIGMFEPDADKKPVQANRRALEKEIAKAKAQTDGIIGVNVMIALSDWENLVDCAVKEGADMVFLGAGLPLRLPKTLPMDDLDGLKTKFSPIVSSARAASLIFRSWDKLYSHVPDAVVVEGPLAGGHLGFKRQQIDDPAYSLENIVPDVLAFVKTYEDRFSKSIPVIVGGGIYTGADIHRFMQMGASGVQMGTRFVATKECDASEAFKQTHIDCGPEDIILIDSPVGLPGRAIRNSFLKLRQAGIKEPFTCLWRCLRSCEFKKAYYCIARALMNAQQGDLEHGFAFAGANAYRSDKIITVKELVATLVKEFQECALRGASPSTDLGV